MNDFMTWDVLTQYATFVTVVFMAVEFTKELPYLNFQQNTIPL